MRINGTKREHTAQQIRVEAPLGVDRLTIAQAIVGRDVLLKAEHVAPIHRNPFERWLVMRQLFDKVNDAYGKRLDRLVAEIGAYIEKNILQGEKLQKAETVVDPAHLDKIAQMVIDHHAEFVADFGGANTKAEVARLVKEKKLPEKSMDAVFDSFTYGLLTGRIAKLDTAARTKKMSYVNFTQRKKRKPFTLTERMKNAVKWMKRNAGEYIRNYGNKIGHELVAVMGEMRNDQKQWRQIASEIGHRTGKWKTDLKRIAATETQRAMQEGYSEGLKEREGDPKGILVIKLPNPDACKNCVKLHLTDGRGSTPRVFTLAELEKNGTNFGRKQREWKAVVGTVHPWCACELRHLPPGWGYERTPPKDKGWEKVPRKKAWRKKTKGVWEYWSPRMVPESLRRGLALSRDLMKATMTYGDSVPEKGVAIRVGDPLMRQAIEEVLSDTPSQLFDKQIGVTLITTDIPRPGVALDEHDLAYWTGNEIRISQTLPYDKVRKVMRHELGHVLNVHLINKWGGEEPVIAWHKKLFDVAKEEGFISKYAGTLPIECAAEATRMYLFERERFMLRYPRQFAMLHEAYRDVFRPDPRANLPQGLEKGSGGAYTGKGKRTGSPGHYKYDYDEQAPQKPKVAKAPKALKEPKARKAEPWDWYYSRRKERHIARRKHGDALWEVMFDGEMADVTLRNGFGTSDPGAYYEYQDLKTRAQAEKWATQTIKDLTLLAESRKGAVDEAPRLAQRYGEPPKKKMERPSSEESWRDKDWAKASWIDVQRVLYNNDTDVDSFVDHLRSQITNAKKITPALTSIHRGMLTEMWIAPSASAFGQISRQGAGEAISSAIFDQDLPQTGPAKRAVQHLEMNFGPKWAEAMKAVYAETQASLRKKGTKKTAVFRGVLGKYSQGLSDRGAASEVGVWGLSSWSTTLSVAASFAEGGRVLAGWIPIENILFDHRIHRDLDDAGEDEIVAVFETPSIEIRSFRPAEKNIAAQFQKLQGKARPMLHVDELHPHWLTTVRLARGKLKRGGQ